MREVKILNETVKIAFNMAVEITYEEIVDAPFDASVLNRQKNAVALLMAAVLSNNPETEITLDRLMTEANGQEIAELSRAVTEEMTAWLGIPAVDQEREKKQKKGKQGKN